MTKPASPRRTRPSNATKRLGLPDLPAKKRTSAEKQADDKSLADQHAAKAVKSQAAIERMGRLEKQMETDQAATIAPVKPVRPRPRPRIVKSQATADADSEANPTNGKASLIATEALNLLDRIASQPIESTNTVTAVKTKMDLREAISDVRTQQPGPTKPAGLRERLRGVNCEKPLIRCGYSLLTCSYTMRLLLTEATLFFFNLNSPTSATKNAVAGKVKNWAMLIPKSASHEKTSSRSAQSDLKNPGRLTANPSSTTGSKTLTVSDVAVPPPSESIPSAGGTDDTTVDDVQVADKSEDFIPDGTDGLVGGFGDDDQDDEMERTAALLNKKQSVYRSFQK